MKRHVRQGDIVIVIAGKYRGRKGKVVAVLVAQDRVRIEGIAIVRRHLKRQDGGITEKLGSIHISNVQPIDPQTGKGTRVQFKRLADGKKIRVAQRSGEQLGQS